MNLRRLRLRAIWLLVVPFLWFAQPTPRALLIGTLLAFAGLALRAWAAGTIHKERELTTTGPYAHLRNPLYLGSLLLGVGVATAGGHWIWVAAFLGFFAFAYGRTIAGEEELLARLFGERYRAYAAQVPALIPRLRAYRGGVGVAGSGFTLAQYLRNREWEALVGAIAGMGILAAKWWML